MNRRALAAIGSVSRTVTIVLPGVSDSSVTVPGPTQGPVPDFVATREAADRFREEEMTRARQEAQDFADRARSDIQRERDAAVAEVRANFGDLAITAAERDIRRYLDRQAHQELVAQVLEEGDSLSSGPRR